jgi:hypothetical protein
MVRTMEALRRLDAVPSLCGDWEERERGGGRVSGRELMYMLIYIVIAIFHSYSNGDRA